MFEPKWDGWRTSVSTHGGVRLWSRRDTELTRLVPDLLPVLAARLPPDVLLDGAI